MKVLLSLILVLLVSMQSAAYSSQSFDEQKIRAAYLYNFAKFIHWPQESFTTDSDPLIIGIAGTGGFSDALKSLENKSIRQHPIEIRQLNALSQIDQCHILYVPTAAMSPLKTILARLQDRSILSISDEQKFADSGGTIQFVTLRERLRFIVNLEAAQTSDIRIDSQLLTLALEVIEGEQ